MINEQRLLECLEIYRTLLVLFNYMPVGLYLRNMFYLTYCVVVLRNTAFLPNDKEKRKVKRKRKP